MPITKEQEAMWDKANEAINDMHGELDALEDDNDKLTERLQEADAENEHLREKIAELEKELQEAWEAESDG